MSTEIDSLLDKLNLDLPPEAAADEKIPTALDLYRASFREKTEREKLVTLVIALETLAASLRPRVSMVELLRQFRHGGDLNEENPPEPTSVDDVIAEMHARTRSSATTGVLELAKKCAASWRGSLRAAAADARTICSTRNRLTHEGSVSDAELKDSLERARALTPRILLSVLRNPGLIQPRDP